MEDIKAKAVIKLFEDLRSERATYESAWKEIRIYVRPNTVDFNAQRSPGDVRTERMYDGVAMQANQDLSGDVFSDLLNPTERGFGIAAHAPAEVNRLPEIIEWTDYVADAIFHSYGDERSMLTTSAHECIQDVTSFGNGVLLQEWDADEFQLKFIALPLACTYFKEDFNKLVDTVVREQSVTLRQLLQRFPDVTWDGMHREPPERTFTVLHLVQPRADAERMAGTSYGLKAPFKSCWVLKDKAILLKEDGYQSFPYHTPRWNKVADETYGRGPAINCLPAIRMLNRMKLTAIRAAQKATDPTMFLPAEGLRLPYKDFPGGINYYDPGLFPNGFNPAQLEHRGNFPVTFEMMEAERMEIRKAFYTDWLEWFPKAERQTAQEIRELSARKLNKMAPLLGRLQSELMVPMIQRSFQLLSKAGLIPDAPAALEGRTLRVTYVSASARAQAASEANALILFGQELVPMAQVDPHILDAIDLDAYAQELAIKQRVSRRILRSPEQIEAIRNARKEEEQMTALAGAAEPVSKAVKNLSEAQALGGLL